MSRTDPCKIAMLLKKVNQDSGSTLPIILIVGAVSLLGATTVTIVTSQGLFNSIRTQQERQAREIADSGIAETIEILNSGYSDLLVNCYGNEDTSECVNMGTWINPQRSYNCPSADSSEYTSREVDPMPSGQLEKTISTSPNGSYKILSYIFDGTRFYGGIGTLTVEGSVLSDDGSKTLSRVVLKKTFNVNPQDCPQGEDPEQDTSGFAGVCAKSVDLGNNDVYGAVSGNILCTDCVFPEGSDESLEDARALINASNNAVVSGDIFIGGEPCPDIYEFPNDLLIQLLTERGYDPLNDDLTEFINTNTGDLQDYISKEPGENKYLITSSDVEGVNSNDLCITDDGNNVDQQSGLVLSDGEKFTYCLVNNIELSNTEQFEINTTNGPVKIYTLGDVDVGGQRSISQIANDSAGDSIEPPPFRLGLYGRSIDECQDIRVDDPTFQQNVSFSGVSKVKGKGGKNGGDIEAKAASVFVHYPCGKVGINGGAQSTVDECNFEDSTITVDNYLDPSINTENLKPYGDCGGGDVRGVVWAETWDGSNSNQAQLVVPPDSPNDAAKNNGVDFLVAVKRFVAIGTPSWSGFGRVIQ